MEVWRVTTNHFIVASSEATVSGIPTISSNSDCFHFKKEEGCSKFSRSWVSTEISEERENSQICTRAREDGAGGGWVGWLDGKKGLERDVIMNKNGAISVQHFSSLSFSSISKTSLLFLLFSIPKFHKHNLTLALCLLNFYVNLLSFEPMFELLFLWELDLADPATFMTH